MPMYSVHLFMPMYCLLIAEMPNQLFLEVEEKEWGL